ncbi:MAG: hypothetical protein J4G13_13935 [Dehalococcoidia bacterium]|nr:hypothetical protein [Dehalococcoidia bacterium]
MATKKRLTSAQQTTWNGLENMGLYPEDYYDFDADKIKDFPPMSNDLERKLKEIRRHTRQALERLEQRLIE